MSFAQPFTDYEILDRVGSGAMGTVFKARQKNLDRIVALKVLRPTLARNTRYVDRLRREARIVAQLDHPNIVAGYDLGEEGGYHFFVMEFVEGRSLRQLLGEWGIFPESTVLDVAIQVATALDHAFQRGVIHRDIKPGNILITSDEGRVKLTDMGLAKGPEDMALTRDGATVGTPQYVSPEQARDHSTADIRSDLYSLGATLYHMATGQPPFKGASIGELITKLLSEEPSPVRALNPAFGEGLALVIRKLLAKDPDVRYQDPAHLLEDLGRVLREEAPEVDESGLEKAAPEQGEDDSRRTSVARRFRAWIVRPLVLAATSSSVTALIAIALVGWFGLLPGAGGGGQSVSESSTAALRARLDAALDDVARDPVAQLAVIGQFAGAPDLSPADLGVLRGARLQPEQLLRRRIQEFFDELLLVRTDGGSSRLEAFVAEPRNWLRPGAFVDTTLPARFRARVGVRPSELPSSLKTDYVRFVQDTERMLGDAVARRNRAYEAGFATWLRDGLGRLVREALRDGRYVAAWNLLDAAGEHFHGQDGRPTRDELGGELRDALDTRLATAVTALRQDVDRAERVVSERLVALARAGVERIDIDLADGTDPDLCARALNDLIAACRSLPPSSAFRLATNPWQGVEGWFADLRLRIGSAQRRRDRERADTLLDFSYRVYLQHSARAAARLLAGAEDFEGEVGADLERHRALFESTSEVMNLLSIDDLAARQRFAPEQVSRALRARLQGSRLRSGYVLLQLTTDSRRSAPAVLAATAGDDGSDAFIVGSVLPRLHRAVATAAVGDGGGSEQLAMAQFADLQAAMAQGDVDVVARLVAGLRAPEFAEIGIVEQNQADLERAAKWVDDERERRRLVASLSAGIVDGVIVEVPERAGRDAWQVDLTWPASALGVGDSWLAAHGRHEIRVADTDGSVATARRLAASLAVPPDVAKGAVRVAVSLRFDPAEDQASGRCALVEAFGVVAAFVVLPSGEVLARALPKQALSSAEALNREFGGVISDAALGRVSADTVTATTGALHVLGIELSAEPVRRPAVVLTFDGIPLSDARRVSCDRGRAVQVMPLQAVTLRQVFVTCAL